MAMKPKQNYTPGPMDDCQSPPYAILPILKYLGDDIIWDPAVGDGLMIDAFQDKGFNAFGTGLPDCDFFKWTSPPACHVIITNPPYGLKYEWLEKTYELGKPFALLMPVETLGAAKAQRLFKKYGINVILLNRRINFKMPQVGWGSSAQFPTAWFTYRLTSIGQTFEYYDLGSQPEYIHFESEVIRPARRELEARRKAEKAARIQKELEHGSSIN